MENAPLICDKKRYVELCGECLVCDMYHPCIVEGKKVCVGVIVKTDKMLLEQCIMSSSEIKENGNTIIDIHIEDSNVVSGDVLIIK